MDFFQEGEIMASFNPENIPDEMKSVKQWVCWKYQEVKGRKTKVPYQPNEQKADSMNQQTWSSFEDVCKVADDFDGIGFVFSNNSRIMGLDFDHIRDPISGEWDTEALEEIKNLNSYAEMSPSGTGAHVICIANVPGVRRREGSREMYDTGRYFTVTGHHIEGTTKTIQPAQEAVNALYYKWFNQNKGKWEVRNEKNEKQSPQMSDNEILNLCENAKNHKKFIKLYDKGDISGYPSRSEADFALCGLMAFYTQEKEQLDRLFRNSKLYRREWNRKSKYTIENVISSLKEVYSPEKKGEPEQKIVYSSDKLKNIHVSENKRERLQAVKQFIEDNLVSLPKSEVEAIIITDIKEHFNLSRDEMTNVKQFYRELINKRDERHEEAIKSLYSELNIEDEFEGLYTPVWNSERTRVIDVLLHMDKIAMKVLETLNTISYRGQMYVYINGCYENEEEIIVKEVTRIVNGIRKGRFSLGIKGNSANILHNIKYFNPVTEYPFNKESAAVPVKNGIILLDFENKTKTLIPHSSEYKFNYIIPTDYREHADPKPIDDILQQYSPDQVKELYQLAAQGVLQMLGYGPFKKAYLLQGPPDAGKSSYRELLLRTFGARNICDVSLEMLNPKENKFALSSLEGKIFNIHDDMAYFSMKDTGTIKNLTGSYHHEIEKKGKPRYEADIRAVHCFACNKPPKYDGEIKKDIAFWERWVYIYFPNRFEKVLTFYDDNFTSENLSGFLNRVLDYVLEMGYDKKLVCNYSYTDVRNKWAKCADPVYRFVSENMTRAERPMYYKKEDFLELIKEWAKDQGEGEDEEVPSTVTMLSQTIDICSIDKDAQVIDEKTGMDTRVYGIPYTWKEESVYKNKKQQVISLKRQATLSN
jgi:primase-polymerase (primpol)-like protein/phage/plasmid-associated DNA primase